MKLCIDNRCRPNIRKQSLVNCALMRQFDQFWKVWKVSPFFSDSLIYLFANFSNFPYIISIFNTFPNFPFPTKCPCFPYINCSTYFPFASQITNIACFWVSIFIHFLISANFLIFPIFSIFPIFHNLPIPQFPLISLHPSIFHTFPKSTFHIIPLVFTNPISIVNCSPYFLFLS